jgi:hypothetical protein
MSDEREKRLEALRAWVRDQAARYGNLVASRGPIDNVNWLLAELDAAEARERETAGVLNDVLHARGLDRLLEAAREEGRREGAEDMRDRAAAQCRELTVRWRELGERIGGDNTFRAAIAHAHENAAEQIHVLPLPGDASAGAQVDAQIREGIVGRWELPESLRPG